MVAPAWSFTFNSEQTQSRRTHVDSNEGGIPRLVPSLFSVFALLILIAAVYLLPRRLYASQFFFCMMANKYESGKYQYN